MDTQFIKTIINQIADQSSLDKTIINQIADQSSLEKWSDLKKELKSAGIDSKVLKSIYSRIWRKTDKGKESMRKALRKYNQSDKGKESMRKALRKYSQSDKGKESNRKYSQSDKGKNSKQRRLKISQENREWALSTRGNCCENCGSTEKLEWAHKAWSPDNVNPSIYYQYKDRTKLKNELDKCFLWCKKCHGYYDKSFCHGREQNEETAIEFTKSGFDPKTYDYGKGKTLHQERKERDRQLVKELKGTCCINCKSTSKLELMHRSWSEDNITPTALMGRKDNTKFLHELLKTELGCARCHHYYDYRFCGHPKNATEETFEQFLQSGYRLPVK